MPCFANETCARRSSNKEATTYSRSKEISSVWKKQLPQGSVSMPAPAGPRRLFPPQPLPPPERVHSCLEKGHGRVEKRTVRATSSLTLRQKWPGLAQGLEITRERTVN